MSKKTLIKNIPTGHFGGVTDQVLSGISNGKCSVVTGIPGYGMEFFAKNLRNILHANRIKTILLDVRFPKKDLENEFKNQFEDQLGQQFLQLTVEKFLRKNKIVLIMSEVREPINENDISFFDSLRWISSENFIVVTVADHIVLSENDSFHTRTNDVFNSIKIVKPFDKDRVEWIIRSNNKEYNWGIPNEYSNIIYKMSGGIPALVKYICMALYEEGIEFIDQPDILVTFQPLKRRVDDIVNASLQLDMKNMHKLGLINQHGNLRSELVKIQLGNLGEDPFIRSIPELTETERRLFHAFYEGRGKVISKDQISKLILQSPEDYSEWAIYKAVQRLRDKVEGKYEIVTKKGLGWVMKL